MGAAGYWAIGSMAAATLEEEEVDETELDPTSLDGVELRGARELDEEIPRATVDVREDDEEERGAADRDPWPEINGTSSTPPSVVVLVELALREDGAWPDLLTMILPLMVVSVVEP